MNKFNTLYIFAIAMVSAMGGLLFGYDWVVIGGAKPFYELYFSISNSPAMQGWAMSSALIGCLIGATTSGVFSDRYGRKKLLLLASVLFTLSAYGTGACYSFSGFIIYRIIGGIGIGLASTLSPMFIAEIAPSYLRGRLVSLNQLTIVIGILMAQIVNLLIADPISPNTTSEMLLSSWNGQEGWRWMFWAECVPALLFFGLMFIVPESPRWLAKNADKNKVLPILSRIGGNEYAEKEYKSIRKSMENEKAKVDFKILLSPSLRFIVVMGTVLAALQQWCGINIIFNYAEDIFSDAGYEVSDILFNIVITGSVNLLFTILALVLVDRFGRRPLMLLGFAGLSIVYALIGAAYYFEVSGVAVLILVLMAIGLYAMSLAPVIWVVLSEIFPNRIRGAAMSVATFALWSACFLLTATFPILNSVFGTFGTFWMYGGICIFGFYYVYKYLPETKGKSLEELEILLSKKSVSSKTEKVEIAKMEQ